MCVYLSNVNHLRSRCSATRKSIARLTQVVIEKVETKQEPNILFAKPYKIYNKIAIQYKY